MPRWTFCCNSCKQEFTYRELALDNRTSRRGFFGWLGVKPEFSGAGVTLECPNCKDISVYKSSELVYRIR